MTLKLKFGNSEKLVPTQKPTQMFGLKFGMQGLTIKGELKVYLLNLLSSSLYVLKLHYNHHLGISLSF